MEFLSFGPYQNLSLTLKFQTAMYSFSSSSEFEHTYWKPEIL